MSNENSDYTAYHAHLDGFDRTFRGTDWQQQIRDWVSHLRARWGVEAGATLIINKTEAALVVASRRIILD